MNIESIERYSKYAYVGFLLSMCILPFLVLSLFLQPQYDDFSVWAVLNQYNYFEAQSYWYSKWTGRYTAHALMGLFHPIIYRNISMLGVVAVVMQSAFFLSLFYFVKKLLPSKTSLLNLGVAYTCFLVVFIWQLPSPAEAFYWIPATFSYQLGLILILLFFGLLWGNYNNLSKRRFTLLIILAILIPGTCEINILIFATLLFCTFSFEFSRTKSINRNLLILLGLAALFSMMSVFSPGNSVRSGAIQNIEGAQPGNIAFTIITAIKIIKGQLLPLFLKSPLLIVSMLFIWAIAGLKWKKTSNLKFWHLSVYKIIWLGIYFFIHLPFIFKAGIEYTPGRVLNLAQFLFIAGWFVFLGLLVVYYKVQREKNTHLSLFFFIITLFFLVIQLILPNKIQSAVRDYTSGNASNYKSVMNKRYDLFEKSEGTEVVVEPLKNIPYTIFIADVTDNPDEDRNKLVSMYFNLESIRADSSLSAP